MLTDACDRASKLHVQRVTPHVINVRESVRVTVCTLGHFVCVYMSLLPVCLYADVCVCVCDVMHASLAAIIRGS